MNINEKSPYNITEEMREEWESFKKNFNGEVPDIDS